MYKCSKAMSASQAIEASMPSCDKEQDKGLSFKGEEGNSQEERRADLW